MKIVIFQNIIIIKGIVWTIMFLLILLFLIIYNDLPIPDNENGYLLNHHHNHMNCEASIVSLYDFYCITSL